ncbi:MAG: 1,4-dihydroxy-2-naphthoate octaprenyltransferase [Porphyromonadaceae bacterium]|nr:1,4-dihydroxy-2-naphthoate octaprenyltransferase [Porphyromonadaceae bacterium]
MKPNYKLQPWVKLIRPFTLTASLSPVLVAVMLAIRDHSFDWLDSLLCIIVALAAQITSNIANEYFDFTSKTDDKESLGPNHPMSMGWLSKTQVKGAMVVSIMITALAGLMLCYLHSWAYLLLGMAVCLGAIGYSAGPWPFSKHGLGDLAVFLFYGIVPTFFTYYLQAGRSYTDIWLLAVGMGLISDCILIVNNYRDYEDDRQKGKKTIIVMFGKEFGPKLYFTCGALSLLLLFPFAKMKGFILLCFYILIFTSNFRALKTTEGKALNKVLAKTALMVLAYALVASLLLLLEM